MKSEKRTFFTFTFDFYLSFNSAGAALVKQFSRCQRFIVSIKLQDGEVETET